MEKSEKCMNAVITYLLRSNFTIEYVRNTSVITERHTAVQLS